MVDCWTLETSPGSCWEMVDESTEMESEALEEETGDQEEEEMLELGHSTCGQWCEEESKQC